MLVFTNFLSELMKQVTETPERDALAMAQVAKKIRTHIFHKNEYKFDGSFPSNCQISSVPRSLQNLELDEHNRLAFKGKPNLPQYSSAVMLLDEKETTEAKPGILNVKNQ